MTSVAEAIKQEIASEKPPLKLNLGAGKSRIDGFLSVDSIPFEGLDAVADLNEPWPWADNSVDEILMSHVLEHFTGKQRVHIFNEMFRVLIDGGKVTIITPHWASNRAYGDYTHAWPPVSEMLYYYLNKTWRASNAPHNDIEYAPDGYRCNFDATWGYGMHQGIMDKNQDYQNHALQFWKEAAQDLHATLYARK